MGGGKIFKFKCGQIQTALKVGRERDVDLMHQEMWRTGEIEE